jgi:hypothetical protein
MTDDQKHDLIVMAQELLRAMNDGDSDVFDLGGDLAESVIAWLGDGQVPLLPE